MNASVRRALAQSIILNAVDIADAKPGDIVAAHSTGIIAKLIRLFTRSPWNHIAIIVETAGTVESTYVIQAQARGVVRAPFTSAAPGGSTAILPCPSGVSRELVVSEATAPNRHGSVGIAMRAAAMASSGCAA